MPPSDLTIHEAAERALKEIGQPTHVKDLRLAIESKGYFKFKAKDPERALGVQLDRHSKNAKIPDTAPPQVFYRAAPATYGLLAWLPRSILGDNATD